MAIRCHPWNELDDAIAQVNGVQKVARKPIKSGIRGAEIYEATMTKL